MEYGFLSLVDSSLACPFLENGRCLIYDYRSFNSRVWGHASEEEYYSFIDEARKELKAQRDFWINSFGIRIPDDIVYGHKTFCTDMEVTMGSKLTVRKRESLRERLARLDTRFLGENVGSGDLSFLELPLFVCFTFLESNRFFNSRPYIMEEYLKDGNKDFLEGLIRDSLLPLKI